MILAKHFESKQHDIPVLIRERFRIEDLSSHSIGVADQQLTTSSIMMTRQPLLWSRN